MHKNIEIKDLESLLQEKQRLKSLIDESSHELNTKVKHLQDNFFDESVKLVFSNSKYGSWIPSLLGISHKTKDSALLTTVFAGLGIMGKYTLSKYSLKLVSKILRLFT